MPHSKTQAMIHTDCPNNSKAIDTARRLTAVHMAVGSNAELLPLEERRELQAHLLILPFSRNDRSQSVRILLRPAWSADRNVDTSNTSKETKRVLQDWFKVSSRCQEYFVILHNNILPSFFSSCRRGKIRSSYFFFKTRDVMMLCGIPRCNFFMACAWCPRNFVSLKPYVAQEMADDLKTPLRCKKEKQRSSLTRAPKVVNDVFIRLVKMIIFFLTSMFCYIKWRACLAGTESIEAKISVHRLRRGIFPKLKICGR